MGVPYTDEVLYRYEKAEKGCIYEGTEIREGGTSKKGEIFFFFNYLLSPKGRTCNFFIDFLQNRNEVMVYAQISERRRYINYWGILGIHMVTLLINGERTISGTIHIIK
jgi:hypothetical protein